jgi:hypothetical protein
VLSWERALDVTIALIVLASVAALVGWVLSLAGISGTWLILAATIGADLAIDGDVDFVVTSIVFGICCAGAEGIELLSGLLGAKTFGGSRWSQIGAFAGTIAGGVVGSGIFPIVGTIVGAVLGGFAGALLGEVLYSSGEEGKRRAAAAGMKAGFGAMLARVVSISVKSGLATSMLVWFVVVVVSGLSDR